MNMEPGDGAKEEKKSESSIVAQEPVTNMERSSLDAGPNTSSTKKNEVDELEKAKAEMGGVIEENQRLKKSLNKIQSEYHTLQMQFNNIAEKNSKNSSDKANNKIQEINEESELVSLSLGRLPSNPKAKVSKPLKEEENKEGLALGLDCKFETSKSESTTEHLPNPSPVNSSEAVPKEEAGETWPPSKLNKTSRVGGGEDEVLSQQNPAKKARVCVRARCDTPTLNDGCQWRKYGQKISKGNPCPRAYYRCTVAMSCPVRKQVQRCAQDMSILITTYEGTHNHPLPLSATAMASTTSAAASVLLSGSSTSHSGATPSPTITTTGMNFYLSDNISSNSKSNQFFLSPPSLSASLSHPTITLDLTSNPPSSTSSSPFRRFTSNYPSSSTSLSFNTSSESNAVSWSNGLFESSNSTAPKKYNNMNIPSNINLGRQAMENNIYYSYMQRNVNNNVPIPSQYSLPSDHTIAAATKAITADPSFQSALAAALTSVIGTQGNLQGVGENLGNNKMKWGELFSSSSISGCASSSLLNKAPTTTQTTGSFMCLQQQPLPFSTPKSASSASPDDRDNAN